MTIVYVVSGTSWTVPADWNSASNTIENVGGGGAGRGGSTSSASGAGAGGGEYRKIANQTLSPNVAVTVQVGAGGATVGTAGTATFVKDNSSTIVIQANGGAGGDVASLGGAGGTGGTGAGGNNNGGAGGAAPNGNGGGGGGGAGGPLGVGGAGAASDASGGGGGGGNGGGSAGVLHGAGGNNNGGTGGGALNTAGTAGGGGGGSTGGNGGNGGPGTEWDSTHGSGGGGGGGGSGGADQPGNGGLYGGGGGGSNGALALFGTGANGIIVATYTPLGSVPLGWYSDDLEAVEYELSDAASHDFYADAYVVNRADVQPPIPEQLPQSFEWEDPNETEAALWPHYWSQAPPIDDNDVARALVHDSSDQPEYADDQEGFADAPLPLDNDVAVSRAFDVDQQLEEPDEDFGFSLGALADVVLAADMPFTEDSDAQLEDEEEPFGFVGDIQANDEQAGAELSLDVPSEEEDAAGFSDAPLAEDAPMLAIVDDASQQQDEDEFAEGFADAPLAADPDQVFVDDAGPQLEDVDEDFAFVDAPLSDDAVADQIYAEDATRQPPDPEDEDFAFAAPPLSDDSSAPPSINVTFDITDDNDTLDSTYRVGSWRIKKPTKRGVGVTRYPRQVDASITDEGDALDARVVILPLPITASLSNDDEDDSVVAEAFPWPMLVYAMPLLRKSRWPS